MNGKILIIDDEVDICFLLSRFLGQQGYTVKEAYQGSTGLDLLKKEPFDVVLSDFRLPDTDGLEMLEKIKQIRPGTAVIIITGYSDVKVAVQAIKKGAVDYVTKPIFPEEILEIINKALKSGPKGDHPIAPVESKVSTAKTSAQASAQLNGKTSLPRFIRGEGPASIKLYKHLDLVAPTELTVLIEGETGTGKESVARMIHDGSPRADKPFIAVDCGALPRELAASELFGHIKGSFTGAHADRRGVFEQAEGGTLFLDEVGNLEYDIQVKLLRVLQERIIRRVGAEKEIEVDVRIIAATNEDIKSLVAEGEFREDLFYRLNEFRIHVPSLRERREDIMQFAQHFLAQSKGELKLDAEGFSDEAAVAISNYKWEGNLRELRNVIRRSLLLAQGGKIEYDHLPPEITGYVEKTPTIPVNEFEDLKTMVEKAEGEMIRNVLIQTRNNKTEAARILNIDRKTLYNKMKAYDIE